MEDVLLGMTRNNLEGIPVSWGKMLTYIGLWLQDIGHDMLGKRKSNHNLKMHLLLTAKYFLAK